MRESKYKVLFYGYVAIFSYVLSGVFLGATIAAARTGSNMFVILLAGLAVFLIVSDYYFNFKFMPHFKLKGTDK